MDIPAFEIAKQAAENRQNSTEVKSYWVPSRCVDILTWVCLGHLVPFRRLVRKPDFVWSGEKLMARQPWVSAPILCDWDPHVGACMTLMAIKDSSASNAFQMFYISSKATLDHDMVNAMFDHFILSSGGELPETDLERMTNTLGILEDWIKTLR